MKAVARRMCSRLNKGSDANSTYKNGDLCHSNSIDYIAEHKTGTIYMVGDQRGGVQHSFVVDAGRKGVDTGNGQVVGNHYRFGSRTMDIIATISASEMLTLAQGNFDEEWDKLNAMVGLSSDAEDQLVSDMLADINELVSEYSLAVMEVFDDNPELRRRLLFAAQGALDKLGD